MPAAQLCNRSLTACFVQLDLNKVLLAHGGLFGVVCWVVFGVTVGSSNFPRRFHPKVFKGPSGFNVKGLKGFKGFRRES